MNSKPIPSVEIIPIDQITVVNPRVRNRKTFKEITANIAELGLKRPVTVTPRDRHDGPRYDLVCGQGRLEAYRDLGQTDIPARIVDADAEDILVMSLVENLARRHHNAIDLLYDIEGLKKRGYREPEIARKTDLSVEYVRGVIRLLEKGEHRLLRAVESGQIPVSVAVEIAEADDTGVQWALQQAYENNLLRGKRLIVARRLIEDRRLKGKGTRTTRPRQGKAGVSPSDLLREYRKDVDKKRLLVRKAERTHDLLVFVTEALRKLFSDENFVTLLRAEGLETLPAPLAERIRTAGET